VPRSRKAAEGDVQARVLLDSYDYYEECENPETPLHSASKGDVISVSKDEFDRGLNMVPQALAKASDKDARTADQPLDLPENLDEVDEAELRRLAKQVGHDVDDDTTRDELVAMVAAAPGKERPQV
jgi:hypothetical protein